MRSLVSYATRASVSDILSSLIANIDRVILISFAPSKPPQVVVSRAVGDWRVVQGECIGNLDWRSLRDRPSPRDGIEDDVAAAQAGVERL